MKRRFGFSASDEGDLRTAGNAHHHSRLDGSLGRQDLLVTDDLDLVCAEMTRAISQHVARPEQGVRKISAAKTEMAIGDLRMIQISYGAEIAIKAETSGSYFLLQIPLSGSAYIGNGKNVADSHSGMGTIIHPDLPLDYRFSADFDLLILRLSADKLERHCAQLLGERGSGIGRRLQFDFGLSLTGVEGTRWLRLLKYMRDETMNESGSLLLQSPLALASFDQMVMNALLSLQPHNYREALFGRSASVVPACVRRAEDFIRAHAAEPLTIVDIANAAGISARSLHRSFQEFRGTSPLAWLKAIRLQHVHDELLAGEPQHISITAIALKWGFYHLGHFGQDYKHRFGETPVETLRRMK